LATPSSTSAAAAGRETDAHSSNLAALANKGELANAFIRFPTIMKKGKKNEVTRKPEYPQQTAGSKIAREAREQGNKLTKAQREELQNAALALIYGGKSASKAART
jgi:hypothetical protein